MARRTLTALVLLAIVMPAVIFGAFIFSPDRFLRGAGRLGNGPMFRQADYHPSSYLSVGGTLVIFGGARLSA